MVIKKIGIHDLGYQNLDHDRTIAPLQICEPESPAKETDLQLTTDTMLAYSGKGRYQHLLTASLVVGFMASAFVYTLFGLATPSPTAVCEMQGHHGPVMKTCTEHEACRRLAEGKHVEFIFKYDNWVKDYDLYCSRTKIRAAGESTMLTISPILSTIVLYLSDFKGRLVLVYACALLYVVGSVGTLLVDDFIGKSAMMGLANTPEDVYGPLLAIVTSEYTVHEARFEHLLTLVGWIALPLGKVLSSLLAFVSLDVTYLTWCTVVACCLGGIAPVLAFKESPVFLLLSKDSEKLMTTLDETRSMNKLGQNTDLRQKTLAAIDHMIKENPDFAKSEFSPLKTILTNRSLLLNVVAMCLIGTYFQTVFTALALNLGQIGNDNVLVNSIVLAAVQLVGAFMAIPIIEKMKPSGCVIWSHIVLILSGLALLAVGLTMDPDQARTKDINLFISGIIIPFAISTALPAFFIYVTDLFPSKVNGTAFSVISIVLGILTSGEPWLTKYSQYYGYHFMVGCTLPGIVSLPLIFLLKEHKGEL